MSVNEGSDRAVPTVGVEEKGRGGNHGPEKRVQLQWDRILVSVGLIGAVLLARGAKVLVRKIIRSVLLVFFLYEVGMNFASFPRSTPGNKLGLVVAKGRQTMSEISSGRWGPAYGRTNSLQRCNAIALPSEAMRCSQRSRQRLSSAS